KDDNVSEIKSFSQTGAINTGTAANKLSVRRVGGLLSFYVNDQNVYSMPYQRFYGNGAGYVVYNKMAIEVEDMFAAQGKAMPQIFQETFNNNNQNWLVNKEDSAMMAIAKGRARIRGTVSDGYTAKTKEIILNAERNFEFEVSMRQVGGEKGKGYGLTWGGSDVDNALYFMIDDYGRYAIIERKAGKDKKLVDWTQSGQVIHLRATPNKLLVRKTGQEYHFFLNDIWLDKMELVSFMGQQVGIAVQGKGLAMLDNFFVREGDKSAVPADKPDTPVVVDVGSTDDPVTDVETPASPPRITLLSPKNDDITIDAKSVKYRVGIMSSSALKGIKLIVNDEQVPMKAHRDPTGEYALIIEQEIDLQEDQNEIKLLAKNEAGLIQRMATNVTVKLPHQPIVRDGNDYALFFATDEYETWSDLVNPVNDVRTIARELETNYGFNTELVIDASRKDVLKKLKEYARRKYDKNDQLMIFFAGHGKFDEFFGEGYVVCTNSSKVDEGNDSYISHSSLRTIVNNINCGHTFLVMDVCFGGTIDPFIAQSGNRGSGDVNKELTQTEFVARKMKFKTRRYLTSGGKEYVPDGTPGHHSPFARKFLAALRNYGGHDRIMTLAEMVLYFERLMPEPRYGEFGNNEPGSDFLFIAR
ncbi:MAG: caspase family protein, partial [Bacteroidota bacterium]